MTIFRLFTSEVKAVLSNPIILLTVLGGVVFYSFLYPLPYSHQTPVEQKVTVVNLDKSRTSFQLERMVDATPQVQLVNRASSIDEAKDRFLSGEVNGILVIPEHFYRDLLQGKSPSLSFAGDAAYFLVYGTIVEGLASASGTLAAQVKVASLLAQGEPISTAFTHYSASNLNIKPTFNPEIGYLSYVVPAVFILILQQTLIMGVGILSGTQKYGVGYWSSIPTLKLVFMRSTTFVAIYYLLAMYYFGFSFNYYQIHRLADPLILLALLAPFLYTSSFIGIILGNVLPRRELVTVVALFSSMPLIFCSGFIWPLEAIPEPVIWISQLFPSTLAIQAMLKTNQMGAAFDQVISLWELMWAQFCFWGMWAIMFDRKYRLKTKY